MIHLFSFTWNPGRQHHYEGWIEGRAGLVLNWRAAWVGAHWGSYNRRLCINLLPFVTLWITMPGGVEP